MLRLSALDAAERSEPFISLAKLREIVVAGILPNGDLIEGERKIRLLAEIDGARKLILDPYHPDRARFTLYRLFALIGEAGFFTRKHR